MTEGVAIPRTRGFAITSTALTLLTAGAAAALAFFLGRVTPDERVQLVSGEDALSVAFGGAKEAISQAMVQKADSYFHGGIDMECSCHHDDHHDEDSCESCARQSNNQTIEHSNTTFDPWRWINARIRAPQVHRHLDGKDAVEMIPWLWASVKTNPHNIDSWTTAWYTAHGMMKNRALAAAILEEGLARNPDSVELRFFLGRHLYDCGKGDLEAAERVFAQAREVALKACDGDFSRLERKESESLASVLDYLSALAERRGDQETVRTCLSEAERMNAASVIVEAIRRRIRTNETEIRHSSSRKGSRRFILA